MTEQEFQKFVVEYLVKLCEGQEKIQQDIARIEIEHGEKLAALFDSYKSIKEILAGPYGQATTYLETHEIQI